MDKNQTNQKNEEVCCKLNNTSICNYDSNNPKTALKEIHNFKSTTNDNKEEKIDRNKNCEEALWLTCC